MMLSYTENFHFEAGMFIHIFKAENLPASLLVTPITHLGLWTSAYKLPNNINPSFYFKFVTAS